MRLTTKYRPLVIGVWLLGAVAFISCSSDKDAADNSPSQARMPIQLTIPAGNGYLTRVIGDPGSYEHFELPRHLYLYIISTKTDDSKELIAFAPDYHQSLDPAKWQKEVNAAGGYPSFGDSLYRYSGSLSVMLPTNRKSAVVYAVLSAEPLTIGTPSTAAPEDLTFTVEQKNGSYTYLRDIYSTPYNLGKNGTAVSAGNDYYGTVLNYTSNVPTLNLMLYHVAAKVDVTWNIAAEAQPTLQMTSVGMRRLMNETTTTTCGVGQALLFRPTENVVTESAPLGSNLSLSSAADVDCYFYGRAYAYVIPYKYDGAYRTSMTFNDTYLPTFYTAPESDIFTPWIRYNLTFTQMPASEIDIEM